MNRLKSTILICALVTITGLLKAQTVVLLNGIPTKVVLDGTKIVSIGDEVDSHMEGYVSAETPIQHSSNPDFIDATSTESVSIAAVSPPIASTPVTTTARPVAKEVKPAEVKPVTNKPLAGNYFNFSGNSALLSEAAINEIKAYASKITSGEAASVLLESFYDANNKKSEELVQNRLDGCKRYFEVNGVASDLIQVSKIADNQQSNKVSVRLK